MYIGSVGGAVALSLMFMLMNGEPSPVVTVVAAVVEVEFSMQVRY